MGGAERPRRHKSAADAPQHCGPAPLAESAR
nr:MAG TPA: hypothetical protein [Caudoviricetes sp.]